MKSLLPVLALALATSAVAQQTPPPADRWQIWLKGQAMQFENFFQATDAAGEEDISAFGGEVGTSFGVTPALRVYGSVNALKYDTEELDTSNGVRIGLESNARPHSFDVYVEQLFDRPSFEVDDVFSRADIRSLVGEYAYRVTDNWQVSIDGELEQQTFDVDTDRDNDFRSLGGAIRWRGNRRFSPELGFRTGERDVDDPTESYDQSEVYLQVRSAVTEALYLSARLRNRKRDYPTGVALSSNFGREDDRQQLVLSADYSFTPSFILNLYASREEVDSTRPDRDFDTGLWLVGFTWRR